MKVIYEVTRAEEIRRSARGGAVSTLELLTDQEIESINGIIELNYPDGISASGYNDIWWFDTDWIATLLGYESFDAIMEGRRSPAWRYNRLNGGAT